MIVTVGISEITMKYAVSRMKMPPVREHASSLISTLYSFLLWNNYISSSSSVSGGSNSTSVDEFDRSGLMFGKMKIHVRQPCHKQLSPHPL